MKGRLGTALLLASGLLLGGAAAAAAHPLGNFTVNHYDGLRLHPDRIDDLAVVDTADSAGSTDFIVKAIQAAPAGSTFAIGTEINLVNRLAAEYPQHTIFCLDDVICPCSTMYRIHPGYLAWVLEGLVDGVVRNRIQVAADVIADSTVALERRLAARPPASAPVADTVR
jgi:quinolinate synthase